MSVSQEEQPSLCGELVVKTFVRRRSGVILNDCYVIVVCNPLVQVYVDVGHKGYVTTVTHVPSPWESMYAFEENGKNIVTLM